MAKAKRQPDEFDPHLEAAKKVARDFFFKNHRMFEVEETDGGKVIQVFGGFWQWHIDHAHKRLYEIVKQQPSDPLKVKMDDDFTLFVRQRTPIRDKLYKWSQEALELHLENLDAATNGVVYVRQKDMLKVPFIISAQDMMARQKRVAKAAMTVLNTCWGPGIKMAKAFGTLGKVLWSQLDPEVCRLALMLGGQKINAFDYNLVWNNLDEVRKVARTVPGILPVWREIATKKAKDTGVFVQPNIVQDTQEHLRTSFGDGNGLTSRGWKWMGRQKPLWVQQLCKLYHPMAKTGGTPDLYGGYRDQGETYLDNRINHLPAALDFLGTVDAQPKFTCFYQTMQGVQRQRRSKEMVAMVRAAFKASLKKPAKTFYRNEISLTMDWITREPNLRFDGNQMKSDWSWFMRKQREWHVEIATRENLKTANTEWPSLVEEFEHNGFVVVPLTTSHDLHIEGKAMHHCVGTYASSCQQGTARIFSIRNKETRQSLATFELRRETVNNQKVFDLPPNVNQYDDDAESKMTFHDFSIPWSVAQCRGACNASVPDLEPISKYTAELYGKACRKLTPKDRFFQVMRPNFKTISVPEPTEEQIRAAAGPLVPRFPQPAPIPVIVDGDDEEEIDNADLAHAILNGQRLPVEVEVDDAPVDGFDPFRHAYGAIPVNADQDPDVPAQAQ